MKFNGSFRSLLKIQSGTLICGAFNSLNRGVNSTRNWFRAELFQLENSDIVQIVTAATVGISSWYTSFLC